MHNMIEKIKNNSEIEQTPLLLAEVGSGGITPGYDVMGMPEGSQIVTVDLRVGRGASDQLHNQLITNVSDLYTDEAKRYAQQGKTVPSFEHKVVYGDGGKMPFAEATFDYTLMQSVISDQDIALDSAAAMITEALRATREDGALLLSDDLTPEVTEERLKQSNGISEKIFRIVNPDDSEEDRVLYRKLRKVPITPGVKTFLVRGENFGIRDLKMYSDYEMQQNLQLESAEAARKAKVEKRQALRQRVLGKLGVAQLNSQNRH